MKLAVIIYHKNADKIYEMSWINACLVSISKQTYQNFDIYECDYGNTNKAYGVGVTKNKHVFFNTTFENHIGAMNFLIEKCLLDGYDVIANINLDDINHVRRFELQLEAIKQGYQLVSSNFHYFTGDNKHLKEMNMVRCGDIELNLRRNHNVICHPASTWHKSFWKDLKYENLLGYEDLACWKKAIQQGKRFKILPEYLLNYRIHSNQVTQTHKGI